MEEGREREGVEAVKGGKGRWVELSGCWRHKSNRWSRLAVTSDTLRLNKYSGVRVMPRIHQCRLRGPDAIPEAPLALGGLVMAPSLPQLFGSGTVHARKRHLDSCCVSLLVLGRESIGGR